MQGVPSKQFDATAVEPVVLGGYGYRNLMMAPLVDEAKTLAGFLNTALKDTGVHVALTTNHSADNLSSISYVRLAAFYNDRAKPAWCAGDVLTVELAGDERYLSCTTKLHDAHGSGLSQDIATVTGQNRLSLRDHTDAWLKRNFPSHLPVRLDSRQALTVA